MVAKFLDFIRHFDAIGHMILIAFIHYFGLSENEWKSIYLVKGSVLMGCHKALLGPLLFYIYV